MILLYLLLLHFNIAYAAHFNGGTITWIPVDSYQNGSSITISIQQTYWWIYPDIKCAKNVPSSTTGRSTEVWKLICTTDCSTDGGYSLSPINSSTDCIQVSSGLGLMTSQRTVNRTLANDTHFYLTFRGNAWVALNSPAKYNSQWSITTLIDLRMRPDGFINTPPTASVISPRYVIVNKVTQIPISVSDADAGDVVRCRWSTYTSGYRRKRDVSEKIGEKLQSLDQTSLMSEEKSLSIRTKRALSCFGCSLSCFYSCPCSCTSCTGTTCTGARCLKLLYCVSQPTTIDTTATMKSTTSYPTRQAIDECGDACYPSSLPSGTNLSNCTITTKGLVTDTWYAVAVQIEDFINESSTTAMSSTPIQFLIYVMPEPDCASPPKFVPITRCLEVTVGVTIKFNLSASNQCNPADYDIADIIISKNIAGVNKSAMVVTSNNALAYVTITWTPTIDQLGLQQLCAIAFSDAQIQSDEYCLSFTVMTTADVCKTTTTSTTTTSTTSRTTTTTSTTETTSTSTTSTTSTTTTTSSTSSTTSSTSSSTTSTTTTTSSTSSTTSSTSSSTTSTTTTTSSTTSTSTTTTTTSTSTTSTTTTSQTTTTTTTLTTSATTNSSSWGLLAGIIAAALPLTLCSCVCLYRFWSAEAKRRRELEEITNHQFEYQYLSPKKQSSSQTTIDNTENTRIRKPSKSYQIYNISSENNANLSSMKSESSILVTMYKNGRENSQNNDNQSFEMENIRTKSNTPESFTSHSILNRSSTSKIHPLDNFNDSLGASNNSWIDYTKSEVFSTPSDFDGLINKYKIQEQNRAKSS